MSTKERNFDYYSFGESQGYRTTLGVASKIAIPTLTNGSRPRWLLCVAFGGTDTNVIYISPTMDANGIFTAGFSLDHNNATPIVLNVHGYTHIGVDRTGANDTTLCLYPLEDY